MLSALRAGSPTMSRRCTWNWSRAKAMNCKKNGSDYGRMSPWWLSLLLTVPSFTLLSIIWIRWILSVTMGSKLLWSCLSLYRLTGGNPCCITKLPGCSRPPCYIAVEARATSTW